MKRGVLWLLMACLLLAAVSCAWHQEEEEPEEGYLVCYLSSAGEPGGDAIERLYVPLEIPENAELAEVAEAVVEQMLTAPEGSDLKSAFPAGTEVLNVALLERRAMVDLSSGIGWLEGVELTMADYCLTLALTALDGINSVTVTSQGRMMVQQPKQVFYERDVLLSTMYDALQTVDVVLYFVDETNAMVGEKRTLEIYEGQAVAENLVLKLLEGPESRELKTVIPEEFSIISVKVENGVCYVNLPAAALSTLPEEEEQQRLILWTLADSLYSLDTIEELKFLADGTELKYFGGVSVSSVAARPAG